MNNQIINSIPVRRKKSQKTLHEVEIIYNWPSIGAIRQINSAADSYKLLKELYDPKKINYKEMFYVLLLNRANFCIGISMIGVGGTAGVMVNIKEIFQLAIKTNASGIILSHNHPSGNKNPSEADKILTKKVKEACSYVECTLLDHLILTSDGYLSFAEESLL